ncbi:hypothetical protein ACTFIR_010182 [Dictyostelium discoideum]
MDPLSLFLGSKGQNIKLVSELSKMVLNSVIDSRIQYCGNEPSVFEDDYFESDNFKKSSELIKENTKLICNYIKDSTQFSSLRYHAHMADGKRDKLLIECTNWELSNLNGDLSIIKNREYFKMDSLSLFLGSKGENKKLVSDLSKMVLNSVIDSRIQYSDNGPSIFEDDYFESDNFKKSSELIKENTKLICNYIKDSTQFSSLRYQAHMVHDPLIPGFIGTIAGLFYNSNICSPQSSNKSSFIEYAFANDLCSMVGYDTSKIPDYYNSMKTVSIKEIIKSEYENVYPHGHNTSGGSVSNIEACWSSYWVKFIPVAIKNALLNENDLIDSKNLLITLVDGKTNKLLIECTNWELSNLNGDLSVKLPYQISLECNLPIENVYEIIKRNHLCSLGTFNFFTNNQINQPIYLIPASAHYCFKKAVCLLGLGSDNIKPIKIEPNGRMNINEVKMVIKDCIENQIPIINIISILGSTQEYAVDNIDEIVSIRNQVRRDFNFNFEMHVDGAFGGYSLSCIRDNFQLKNPLDNQLLFPNNIENEDNNQNEIESFDPELIISSYVKKQLHACKLVDSITLDGHKSGYLPYSNSAICYRNSKYKDILTLAPVYVDDGKKNIPNCGVFGIEGSRPGYSSIAGYLTHSITRPSKIGYGKILKRCILNSKLFYISLLIRFDGNNGNNIKVFTIGNNPSSDVLNYLKSEIIDSNTGKIKSLDQIVSNKTLLQILSDYGSDLNGVCFGFNFISPSTGELNNDYKKYIELNKMIIDRFDFSRGPEADLVFGSTFLNNSYGNEFISNFIEKNELKINIPNYYKISIPILRSSTMSPFLSKTSEGSYIDIMIDLLLNEIPGFLFSIDKL